MELVIASQNTHKVLELREIFKDLLPELQVRSLFDFPNFRPEKEVGKTFAENAEEKAKRAAKELNCSCLADDSGLVIPILGGIESTLKSRYALVGSSSIQQTKHILGEMKPFMEIERSAYLECCVALASPSGQVHSATARCEGMIAETEKGKVTFEFDTIFIKYDYSKTLAELPPSVRSRISYRRKACEKLIPAIERLRV
jgi:XTP/dITP diphosphohydrolase